MASSSRIYDDNAVRYDPRILEGHGGGQSTNNDNSYYGDYEESESLPTFISPGNGRKKTRGSSFGSSGPTVSHFIPPSQSSPSSSFLRAMTVVEDGQNRLAFCCFDQARNEIIFEECRFVSSPTSTFMSSDGTTVDVLLEEILISVRPTLLLLNNRIVQNERLFDILTRPLPPPPQLSMQDDEHDDDGEDSEDEYGENNQNLTKSAGEKSPRKKAEEDGSDQNESTFVPSAIPYKILKSKQYDLTLCREVILHKLHVLSLYRSRRSSNLFPQRQPHHQLQRMYATSNYHTLASVIDFESNVVVKAFGSLLSFLAGNLFQMPCPHPSGGGAGGRGGAIMDDNNSHSSGYHGDDFGSGGKITINRIVPANISKYMHVSPATLTALQIFSTEQHPLLSAQGYGNAKEGFSLFSFLDRTKSRGGRQKLREWMLKPLAVRHEIEERHDMVEFFLDPSVDKPVGQLMRLLRSVRSIDKIMQRMSKIAATPRDFLDLSSTLSIAVCIGKILYEDIIPFAKINTSRSCYESLESLYLRCNLEVMMDLKNRMCDMVDEEAMAENKRKSIVIRYGYDDRLDRLRYESEMIDDGIIDAKKILEDRLRVTMPPTTITMMALSPNCMAVMFRPQLGFLVGFIDPDKSIQSFLPEDFEFLCCHDGEDFYYCDETRALQDQHGDLYSEITDLEKQLIGDMEGQILDTYDELQDCFDALSELDCYLSFVEGAIDGSFVKPRMTDGGASEDSRRRKKDELTGDASDPPSHPACKTPIIDIRDGRHPLQEVTSENVFVPNDVYIMNEKSVKVITGPNFSGKSCYLRQVGLIVYMAHVGSFVPSSNATIQVTNHIGARIPTAESCSRPQSSFQRELTEISSILRRSTAKSLVLMDEFGKGTNPVSGISILGATLKYLAKVRCPTVCATHLLELFSMKVISDDHDGICTARMTMKLPDGEKGGKAVPLFKLENGVSPSSAATVCAQSAGISQDVLDRTKHVVEVRRSHNSIYRLWSMDRGDQLAETELKMLVPFASTRLWDPENEEKAKELLMAASKIYHKASKYR